MMPALFVPHCQGGFERVLQRAAPSSVIVPHAPVVVAAVRNQAGPPHARENHRVQDVGITIRDLELSKSQVEYGTSTAYGSQPVEDRSYVNSHSVLLHGLAPGTRCYFRVRGFDKSGFEIRSGGFTFTTLP